MRAAADGGDGGALWPVGCERVEDVPYDLARALPHAHRILNWYENVSEDEMPPQWMWPFEEKLEEHFATIKANRESETIEDNSGAETSLTKNELADVGDRFK